MKLCTVIGHVVSTAKHPVLDGKKILIVSGGSRDGETDALQLAVDGIGAGIGAQVLVSESGAAGSQVVGSDHAPVRSVVVGMADKARP